MYKIHSVSLMNLRKISELLKAGLKDHYPDREIESMTRLIYAHMFGFKPIQVYENLNMPIGKKHEKHIHNILEALVQYQPIQYILGETEFYGCSIKVGKGVLIPRPETEELADWIIQSIPAGSYHILDICTGSGCLIIALSKYYEGSISYATDQSETALRYARENATKNTLKVQYMEHDILNSKIPLASGTMDIIVSNPPYITEKEKDLMLPNVLDWEPAEALFAPEHEPLLFYHSIIPESRRLLKPGGVLFMEINESFGTEVTTLLRNQGFTNVELRKDLSGKSRMVKGGRSRSS